LALLIGPEQAFLNTDTFLNTISAELGARLPC
jgi:hypothetical protein